MVQSASAASTSAAISSRNPQALAQAQVRAFQRRLIARRANRFFTDVEAQFAPFGEAFIPYGLKPPESAKGIVGASRKKVGHR